jgi:hypothetical protein
MQDFPTMTDHAGAVEPVLRVPRWGERCTPELVRGLMRGQGVWRWLGQGARTGPTPR